MVKEVSQEELIEYIRASCEEHGLPFYLSDEATLIAIATILKSA